MTPEDIAPAPARSELPEEKGTYILWSAVTQTRRLEIGRLGRFHIAPGFYGYVGSAYGSGGLRARLQHHLDSITQPHWHIDYLLQIATPTEIWYAVSDRRLEQDWAELLEDTPALRQPIPRFGSSDYRRSRTSHLFHAKRRPGFRWFHQKVRDLFEADVQPCLHLLVPIPPVSTARE